MRCACTRDSRPPAQAAALSGGMALRQSTTPVLSRELNSTGAAEAKSDYWQPCSCHDGARLAASAKVISCGVASRKCNVVNFTERGTSRSATQGMRG